MLESHVIQAKGFTNVGGDVPSGFQIAVRCPYYRGIWASLIEGAELTVDDETFAAENDPLDARLEFVRHGRARGRATSCAGPSRSRPS